jgi:hypothetical protein
VRGDAGEDVVAGEEGGVTIQSALGDVGVGDGHVDTAGRSLRRNSPMSIQCSSGVS